MEDTKEHSKSIHKERIGVVTSHIQDKTIIVRVDRKSSHAKYGKVMIRSKKYYAHDHENKAKTGDRVRLVETRPLSKLKRWQLVEVLT